jgi:hypothetical protein
MSGQKNVLGQTAKEKPEETETNSVFDKAISKLPTVDKVELFYFVGTLYENLPKLEDKTEVPLKSFGVEVRIISSKILLGNEAEEFARLWRKITRGGGMGCVSPAYRLRFFNKDALLLQTDVCFDCNNLLLELPNVPNSTIWGFNTDSSDAKDLLIKLNTILFKK